MYMYVYKHPPITTLQWRTMAGVKSKDLQQKVCMEWLAGTIILIRFLAQLVFLSIPVPHIRMQLK